MDTLNLLVKIGLYAVMGVSVIAAIGVVTFRNLFHAALSLAAVLLGIAGIYLALRAEFLAVVQILLYVGAVMTLVIFAVMLTERFGDKGVRHHNQLELPAFGGTIALAVALTGLIQRTSWPMNPETLIAKLSVRDLGNALMGKYVFPFEVISVVLIAALIGAILMAKRDKAL